jgi:hypothetical protein
MREQIQQPARTATYHAAIDELGLEWQWDPATYGHGADGLRAYLQKEQAHLLRVYDADFLVHAVESTLARLDRAR